MLISGVNALLKSKLATIIDAVGNYELQVSSTTYLPATGRTIINFKATNAYHVGEIIKLVQPFKALLTDATRQDVDIDLSDDQFANLNTALNLGLSANARPTDFIPEKGEYAKVRIGLVELKDKSGFGLMVTNISTVATKATKRMSLDSIFGVDAGVVSQQPAASEPASTPAAQPEAAQV